jgi:hypothetical protein
MTQIGLRMRDYPALLSPFRLVCDRAACGRRDRARAIRHPRPGRAGLYAASAIYRSAIFPNAEGEGDDPVSPGGTPRRTPLAGARRHAHAHLLRGGAATPQALPWGLPGGVSAN